MKTFVISLRRTPQRYQQFLAANAGQAEIERFDAVEGGQAAVEALGGSRVVDGYLSYTPGALGNALSHYKLWTLAAEQQIPITVCEDDAVLHRDFAAQSTQMLQRLGDDWDIVLWGWNFDSILLAAPLAPLSAFLVRFNQDEMRANKAQYLNAPAQATMLRLRAAFGSVCYSISPGGAARYLSYCFPLRQFTLSIPEVGFTTEQRALDAVMCSLYRDTASYACFPPLAVTDNDRTTSTVQS